MLILSDLYLLPGLKRQCANYIGLHLNSLNAISILRTSRLMQLTKLEAVCTEFIAQNLEKVIYTKFNLYFRKKCFSFCQ